MKSIIAFFLLGVSQLSIGQDYLFSDELTPIRIHNSSEVEVVENDDNYFSLKISSIKYMATAMLLDLKEDENIPTVKQTNEILYRSHKKSYPDLEIVDDVDVYTEFNNRKILGSLFRTKYSGSSMELCDLSYVHEIQDKVYFALTITSALEVCEGDEEFLNQSIWNIFKSIEIKDI